MKTNIDLVTDMMNFSQAGALKQAFIVEAIHRYAKEVIASEPWGDHVLVSHAAWKVCAKECLEAIEKRSLS